jgi:cyclopropane-fatty-acyl-phospholipid synthase
MSGGKPLAWLLGGSFVEATPMSKLLKPFLAGLIKTGSIEIETANGYKFTIGDGSGSRLGLRFQDMSAVFQLMADPELQFGELYMDGRIEVTKGALFDVLMLSAANLWQSGGSRWLRLVEKVRGSLYRLTLPNGLLRARRNVARHHYEFDAAFYRKFLDSGLQYSCAYFEREDQNLENAQLAKKRHIAAKLLIEPGHSVLDIGCGFGRMAIYLARFCGASVTGVTLSQTQLGVARSGAVELGLSGATDFRFSDYRTLEGRFDRIVSVGMFEHVGLAHYDMFFRKVAQLLDEDGIALIHTIGRVDGPWPTNPWVAKHIFPGGYFY